MELSNEEKETVESIAENNREAPDRDFTVRLKEAFKQLRTSLSI
ncbi:hypothetical protein [Candidatus Nanohalobium constans]|nr:hypothetical protein [Candidatus Nanohalobium constans]